MDFDQLGEKFISFQLDGESPLFQILNKKRTTEQLTKEEKSYFNYVRQTFILEVVSVCLAFPTIFTVALFHRESQKRIRDTVKLNRLMSLSMAIGFPSFAVFNMSFYRRLLATPPFYKDLSSTYAYEIAKMKK